jgi:ABC-type microcin C transport system duplicated ATPase subunit YejF
MLELLCNEATVLDNKVGDRINDLLARTEGLGIVGPAVQQKTTTLTTVQPGMAFRHTSVQQKDTRQGRPTRTPEQIVLGENINSPLAAENQRLMMELQKSATADQRSR